MSPPLDIAGRTDPGCVREQNEDCLALDPELGLLVVADGLGGHNAGEVASKLAVEVILARARELVGAGKAPAEADPALSPRAGRLVSCVVEANRAIYEKARAFPGNHGMSTTVVAALADARSLTVAHVGDSRLYLLRGGSLRQLTEDHSWVWDQIKHGLMSPEAAETSQLQNILTRALGSEESVAVDVREQDLEPGDIVLLCSDGLTKMVPDAKAAEILRGAASAQQAADALVALSREAGGVDNITVAVLRVLERQDGVAKGFFSRLFGG